MTINISFCNEYWFYIAVTGCCILALVTCFTNIADLSFLPLWECRLVFFSITCYSVIYLGFTIQPYLVCIMHSCSFPWLAPGICFFGECICDCILCTQSFYARSTLLLNWCHISSLYLYTCHYLLSMYTVCIDCCFMPFWL